MRKILEVSIADSSSLKNEHNKLFLGIMQNIEREKVYKDKKDAKKENYIVKEKNSIAESKKPVLVPRAE